MLTTLKLLLRQLLRLRAILISVLLILVTIGEIGELADQILYYILLYYIPVVDQILYYAGQILQT